MNDKKCVLCSESLSKGDVVTVHKSGRKTLVESSVLLKDNLENILRNEDPLTVHIACRKNYTRKTTINKRKRETENEEDLVPANAKSLKHVKSHSNCDTIKTSGRPVQQERFCAFQKLCKFMEEDEDGQLSLSMLQEKMKTLLGDGEDAYCKKYLKKKIIEHFGDRVTVTDLERNETIFTLTDFSKEIFLNNWLKNRDADPIKIVKAAAEIIRNDIKSKVYNITEYVVDKDNVAGENIVPESLQIFMNNVMPQRYCTKSKERKKEAIAQSIISAVRPRSFIPPLLLNLGVYMHRHYGSKSLVDTMSSFGFSVGYEEVKRFEHSARIASKSNECSEGFLQLAFDNADVNVKTIDGHSTFHTTGGIEIITPKPVGKNDYKIPRVLKFAKSNSGELPKGEIDLIFYKPPEKNGLDNVTMKDVVAVRNKARPLDVLWLVKCSKLSLFHFFGTTATSSK